MSGIAIVKKIICDGIMYENVEDGKNIQFICKRGKCLNTYNRIFGGMYKNEHGVHEKSDLKESGGEENW